MPCKRARNTSSPTEAANSISAFVYSVEVGLDRFGPLPRVAGPALPGLGWISHDLELGVLVHLDDDEAVLCRTVACKILLGRRLVLPAPVDRVDQTVSAPRRQLVRGGDDLVTVEVLARGLDALVRQLGVEPPDHGDLGELGALLVHPLLEVGEGVVVL